MKENIKEVKALISALKKKANKWKQRCKVLRSAFANLKSKATTQEAVLTVSVFGGMHILRSDCTGEIADGRV